MLGLNETGNLSLGGIILVVFCLYLLGVRIARIVVFEQTGRSVLRPRPVVQVVVLGDIGRSPRMRNHAVSLATEGCQVDLIGYVETSPGSRITTNRYIRVRRIRPAWSIPKHMPRIAYLLWAPCKAAFVALQLVWWMGCATQYPNIILIQNPPAIPTLAIAQLVAFLRQSRLVIDWHNFGYSILGIGLGKQHKVVKWAEKYEKDFGRKAYAHLTVTDRMHKELVSWGVSGKMITFKDRPQHHFTRLSVGAIHEFMSRFRLEELVRREMGDSDKFLGRMGLSATLLTENSSTFRSGRPRLIVSSTSWTEDEDFGILLKAIEIYEAKAGAAQPEKQYPHLLFVITGKGPLKAMYEQRISQMSLHYTRIVTVWLETQDYPLLLGSADLGVSLHTSSSGMDLPMKVVDMFGCGLPVCAIGFECLDELVVHNRNGLVFNDSVTLAEQWTQLFVETPDKLKQLSQNVIQEYADQTWEKQWKSVLGKLFVS